MNSEIKNLEPKALWSNFTLLNAIPRGSKKEERVIAFMLDFGKDLNLETNRDEVGNVIIRKPATVGMENIKTIVLQSHLDMVHQKNNDTVFDFDTEGIKMFVDKGWVKAEGTTLGADNGLGVAAIMSILEANDIVHPDIEALFTIDEETGMTGAKGLEPNKLKGEILLNLDTEDENEIDIGCAGGIDIAATKTYVPAKTPSKAAAYKISVKGLRGGHSGMDIHRGYGNSNKVLNRILYALKDCSDIASIDGGGLRNAIPRESKAIVITESKQLFEDQFYAIAKDIIDEYDPIEKNLEIELVECLLPDSVLSKADQLNLLRTIYGVHNGVFRMSPDIVGLVETSSNLARLIVNAGKIQIYCLTRSSVESSKMNLANHLKSGFELGGFKVELSGSYPGWKPNPQSPILKILDKTYETLFHKKAHVMACHAGLECGILGKNYPDIDMVSFGPTIKGAHSPDERAHIESTQRFWSFLLEILKKIPAKA
jgi:dipeptidase D